MTGLGAFFIPVTEHLRDRCGKGLQILVMPSPKWQPWLEEEGECSQGKEKIDGNLKGWEGRMRHGLRRWNSLNLLEPCSKHTPSLCPKAGETLARREPHILSPQYFHSRSEPGLPYRESSILNEISGQCMSGFWKVL